jgi:methoxymalonate biosynthesis acyl carrier protein
VSDEANTEAPADIAREIQEFLAGRLRTAVPTDQDLFATGLVTSMFAMELVVHLEGAYSIAIIGGDLKLDNFRTVERMTTLVTRLRELAAVPRG